MGQMIRVLKRVGWALQASGSKTEIRSWFFTGGPKGPYGKGRARRSCPSLISLIVTILLYPIFASANIELTLSPLQCQPGDVVELHTESSFDELITYELKLPRHDALHLVAHQRQPIEYADGVYSQKDVWVFQPVRAGQIELSGIKAFVKKGDALEELELPSQSIEVLAYPAQSDRFLPEPLLHYEEEQTGSKLWVILLVGGVLFLGCILNLRIRSVEEPYLDDVPTLADVSAALSAHEMPLGLMAQWLADESFSVSDELRTAMERAVYRNDSSALKELLRKEANQ